MRRAGHQLARQSFSRLEPRKLMSAARNHSAVPIIKACPNALTLNLLSPSGRGWRRSSGFWRCCQRLRRPFPCSRKMCAPGSFPVFAASRPCMPAMAAPAPATRHRQARTVTCAAHSAGPCRPWRWARFLRLPVTMFWCKTSSAPTRRQSSACLSAALLRRFRLDSALNP